MNPPQNSILSGIKGPSRVYSSHVYLLAAAAFYVFWIFALIHFIGIKNQGAIFYISALLFIQTFFLLCYMNRLTMFFNIVFVFYIFLSYVVLFPFFLLKELLIFHSVYFMLLCIAFYLKGKELKAVEKAKLEAMLKLSELMEKNAEGGPNV